MKKRLFLILLLIAIGTVGFLSLKPYQKMRLSLLVAPNSSHEERIIGLKTLLLYEAWSNKP